MQLPLLERMLGALAADFSVIRANHSIPIQLPFPKLDNNNKYARSIAV
jgi:hypothetical protein